MLRTMSMLVVLAMTMVANAEAAPPVEQAPSVEEAPPTAARVGVRRTYTVQPGQTLWQIASLTVGDPTLWPALYLANRDQIKDPSRVYPGQELAIPNIDPERAATLRREGGALNTQ